MSAVTRIVNSSLNKEMELHEPFGGAVELLALSARTVKCFSVRPAAYFSVPTCTIPSATRTGAVKAALLARPAGPGLEGPEHGARVACVGANSARIVLFHLRKVSKNNTLRE